MEYTGKLLTTNEKLEKTEKYLLSEKNEKWIIKGLQFLPGPGFCDGHLLGCLGSCLVWTGKAKQFKSVNKGRKKRNDLFIKDRKQFNKILFKELMALSNKAAKQNARIAIRPNVFSSINWNLPENHIKPGKSLFDCFPNITFYDYTEKPLPYILENQRKNYHLTASYKGNIQEARQILKHNISLAIVKSNHFFEKDYKSFPQKITKYHYNGDLSDLRPQDYRGSIVWLSEKQSKKALSY